MPSNFRTYESQSRLLAAVLASNPSLKLNFRAIAQHYGSDSSQSAIEHRFRPIKKQASIIRRIVSEGKDAKDFAHLFNLHDKDIAKYYGESTPQGIEFQFRAIKKDAKALRDAVEQGKSPLATRKNVPAGTSAATPTRGRKPRAPAVSAVAGGTASAASSAAATAAAPAPARRPAKRARLEADFVSKDDEDSLASDEVDYEQLDLTPLSTPSHRMTATMTTAAGGAAASAGAVVAPVCFTPSTTMAAPPTAFFTDTTTATPALSTGVSPADNDSPDNNVVFHTAVQHQRQQPLSFYARNRVTIEDDGDDDDDVCIIDTPTKRPKLETPAPLSLAAVSTSTATLEIGSFDSFTSQSQLASQLPGQSGQFHSQNQNLSQSQSQSPFTFDGSGSSWDSMGFFAAAADPMASFAGTASFYDNDDGI
ncbi:hypothetical protein SCUCBS95973_001681 [Sporothrix curviconia]|uniref:Uncharacterized protein n=1 Tax=Sporothrix curviconia TaxID=1260050 RepID=A0ABP0B0K5_9PEZI